MKVNRAAAVALFTEIGWNAANKKAANNEWMQDKLRAVPKNMPEDEAEFESDESKELAKAICEALENDEDVEFELEDEVESETEKKSKDKKSTKAEAKTEKSVKGKKNTKTEKATKSSKKSGGKPDKNGTSIKARLFALLTKTPRTMKELMEMGNIERNQSGYMNEWAKEGLVKKEGNTYRLAK